MSDRSTKKAEETRTEYRRGDLGTGVRGKYIKACRKGSNLVLLTPELAKVFKTSEAVNEALTSLVDVARWATRARRRPSTT
jgi:hypothetical protein